MTNIIDFTTKKEEADTLAKIKASNENAIIAEKLAPRHDDDMFERIMGYSSQFNKETEDES